ncbi:UNVERIFIED_CONTAM: hypothetical protein FKN15_037305 [Acipenser sinensis]
MRSSGSVARKNASQSMAGNIRVYPDYSNITAHRHRAFSHPIAFTRSRGLQTFLLHPATLKIHLSSTDHLFHSPDDAQGFLDFVGLDGPPQDRSFTHVPNDETRTDEGKTSVSTVRRLDLG